MQIVEADLTLVGDRLLRGCRVSIDGTGRIGAVESGGAGPATTLRLERRALLPGMVSVHSHAFQRALRGRTERFPGGSADFWGWREEMYARAGELTADAFHRVCRLAFDELRAAGFTSIGEFHYLRHEGREPDWAFDGALLAAAAGAGVRLRLMPAHYATGDVGRPLAGPQRRFATGSARDYLRRFDELRGMLDAPRQSLGVAVHSVRASSLEDMTVLHRFALERGLPFQMHVEEQQREVDSCLAAHGARPVDLLLDRLGAGPELIAVHCTATPAAALARLLDAGARLCLCPLTEANLGDAVPRLPDRPGMLETVCLGTDSNVRISGLEEMRTLEYAQRSTGARRGAFLDGEGRVAWPLWRAATHNGAAALGLEAGQIRAGAWADLLVVDLDAPTLAGTPEEDLLDALLAGCSNEVVAATSVGGEWRRHR